MLKNFQSFIEPAAVRVFAFKPYTQREACQKKGREKLEKKVPGK
jgi:hypothetical protein